MAKDFKNNCFVCGEELVYSTTANKHTCVICNNEFDAMVTCKDGHFVCDSCHSAKATDLIVEYCMAVDHTDPIAMAAILMKHPSLKMHGPEHHVLVPAVLVAAYCNATGRQKQKSAWLQTVIKRGSTIPGGACGFLGACGAGVGTGIFISTITGTTPVATESWGLSNLMTAKALFTIAKNGGPRCCKRDTFISILEGIDFLAEHYNVELSRSNVHCSFSALNNECRMADCLFFNN